MLLARHDDPGQVAWFARAVDTSDSEIAPYAALYLASWYQEQGDLEHTVAAYQQAMAHEHPDASPRAAYLLGRLQHAHGQVEEAWAAWQQALDARHPRYSLLAAVELGDMLMRRRTGSTPRRPGSTPASSRHWTLWRPSSLPRSVTTGASQSSPR